MDNLGNYGGSAEKGRDPKIVSLSWIYINLRTFHYYELQNIETPRKILLVESLGISGEPSVHSFSRSPLQKREKTSVLMMKQP